MALNNLTREEISEILIEYQTSSFGEDSLAMEIARMEFGNDDFPSLLRLYVELPNLLLNMPTFDRNVYKLGVAYGRFMANKSFTTGKEAIEYLDLLELTAQKPEPPLLEHLREYYVHLVSRYKKYLIGS